MAISMTTSTLQASITSRLRVADVTSRLDVATHELSTGLYKDTYKELGMRSGQVTELRGLVDRTNSFAINNSVLAGKLETQESALTQIRNSVQEFLDLSIRAQSTTDQIGPQLQELARNALQVITSAGNTSYGGEFLFAGVHTDTRPLQNMSTVNLNTGLSPNDVMNAITGGVILSPGDAATKISAIDDAFSGTSVTPSHNFEETFYNGTPQLTAGLPSPRVTARIGDGEILSYGAQMNDPAMREAIKGLSMFAALDVSVISDPSAYKDWVTHANTALSNGIFGIDKMRVSIGIDRGTLDQKINTQRDLSDVYNNRIMSMEGVDPYEAATRVESLRTQVQSTYAVTARLNSLSFLNYMR